MINGDDGYGVTRKRATSTSVLLAQESEPWILARYGLLLGVSRRFLDLGDIPLVYIHTFQDKPNWTNRC